MKVIRELLTRRDPGLIELFLGLYAVVFGAWVANPLINTFDGATIYRAMLKMLPEHTWGLIILAVGVNSLAALLHRNRTYRCIAANTGCVLWGSLVVLTGIGGDWAGVSVGLFTLITLTEGWVFIRLLDLAIDDRSAE